MRNFISVSVAVVLVFGPAALARAQQEPRAIIDKAIKAHGGEEKLSKVIVKAEHLFPGTYAGNLFKNISKCRDLVAALDGTNTNSPRAA